MSLTNGVKDLLSIATGDKNSARATEADYPATYVDLAFKWWNSLNPDGMSLLEADKYNDLAQTFVRACVNNDTDLMNGIGDENIKIVLRVWFECKDPIQYEHGNEFYTKMYKELNPDAWVKLYNLDEGLFCHLCNCDSITSQLYPDGVLSNIFTQIYG